MAAFAAFAAWAASVASPRSGLVTHDPSEGCRLGSSFLT